MKLSVWNHVIICHEVRSASTAVVDHFLVFISSSLIQRDKILSRTFPAARQRKENQRKDDRKFSERMVDGPKLSVNQATTLRWSFEEAVVRYRLAEINAIGVWLPKLIEFGEEEGFAPVR